MGILFHDMRVPRSLLKSIIRTALAHKLYSSLSPPKTRLICLLEETQLLKSLTSNIEFLSIEQQAW
jgi:hypothetical protein